MATTVGSLISARNQISGRVSSIQLGSAMTVVTIFADSQQIISAITNHAVHDLALKTNDAVLALIKATDTMLVKGDAADTMISARNRIRGRVSEIQKGVAMGSVTIDAGNWRLTSAITRETIDELQIETGEEVTVIFNATDVLLQKA